MPPTDERFVVVGGGVAGLVAARRLALSGAEVVVLEAGDRLGGQLDRHRIAGVELDAAAESFAVRGGTVAALLAELGLADDVVAPEPLASWLVRADGTARPLPATSLLGIPADPLAPDVVAVIGRGAARRAQLDALLPAGVGARSTSLGELVERRMGRGVLEGLVAPVVRGVHSREPGDLSVDAASPRLRALVRERGSLAAAVRELRASSPAGSQVGGLRGGMFRMTDRLVEHAERAGVEFVTGARVNRADAKQAWVDGRRHAGRVVLAASGVVGPPPATRRITLVTLVVDAPRLDAAPRGTGALIASGTGSRVSARALTHLSAKWSWVAEALPGLHVLRLSYDGEPADAESMAVRDAGAILGVALGDVVASDVITWERAASGPGGPTSGVPAIGEAVSGTGLAAVVAQSEAVARRLLADSERMEE